ncbi:hypothetical protein [Caldalkalibacillus salinus]|uniref:hypothetical protein n=1 Tax=Caldalkalibacillus salinus TaxID=2803787 RepID=UPI0019211DF6|nr:hypothetical protein [Caldalkalibacillus salinus]
MAFGITRKELNQWKAKIDRGEIALITHYWVHPRFPECKTVTKAGAKNLEELIQWGKQYGLKPEWIDLRDDYPHFDLIGDKQIEILREEKCVDQLKRFNLED